MPRPRPHVLALGLSLVLVYRYLDPLDHLLHHLGLDGHLHPLGAHHLPHHLHRHRHLAHHLAYHLVRHHHLLHHLHVVLDHNLPRLQPGHHRAQRCNLAVLHLLLPVARLLAPSHLLDVRILRLLFRVSRLLPPPQRRQLPLHLLVVIAAAPIALVDHLTGRATLAARPRRPRLASGARRSRLAACAVLPGRSLRSRLARLRCDDGVEKGRLPRRRRRRRRRRPPVGRGGGGGGRRRVGQRISKRREFPEAVEVLSDREPRRAVVEGSEQPLDRRVVLTAAEPLRLDGTLEPLVQRAERADRLQPFATAAAAAALGVALLRRHRRLVERVAFLRRRRTQRHARTQGRPRRHLPRPRGGRPPVTVGELPPLSFEEAEDLAAHRAAHRLQNRRDRTRELLCERAHL